jgi:hypothetical protein
VLGGDRHGALFRLVGLAAELLDAGFGRLDHALGVFPGPLQLVLRGFQQAALHRGVLGGAQHLLLRAGLGNLDKREPGRQLEALGKQLRDLVGQVGRGERRGSAVGLGARGRRGSGGACVSCHSVLPRVRAGT